MRNSLMVVVGLLMTLTSAFADDGFSTRYSTSYGRFDSNFNEYYSYSERTTTTTTTSTSRSCGFHTCYGGLNNTTITTTSTVHVQETVIRNGEFNGYTRVDVYGDSRYRTTDRYASYYTHNGRVVRRNYHRNHRRIRNRHYYHNDHYRYRVNYVVMDEFTAGIIIGMEFVELGAHVLAACDSDDTACIVLGLASSVSGSLISISASNREAERTELQRRIEAHDKKLDNSDLEDSLN